MKSTILASVAIVVTGLTFNAAPASASEQGVYDMLFKLCQNQLKPNGNRKYTDTQCWFKVIKATTPKDTQSTVGKSAVDGLANTAKRTKRQTFKVRPRIKRFAIPRNLHNGVNRARIRMR